MLTKPQFERVRRLALELAGIELLPRHHEVLDRKARRLGIADSTSLERLLHDAQAGRSEARQQFLKLIITNFTGFFRNPAHFDFAATHLLRGARDRGQSRCWCAGVATGEEAYSLAMTVLDKCGVELPPVDILATDIDAGALEIARQGEYSERAVERIGPEHRERFFVRASGSRRWRISPSVRRLIEFRTLNLADANWSIERPVEVIFCRNVTMYLAAERRKSVLERMVTLLTSNGLLLVDPSEHLGKVESLFRSAKNGVFARNLLTVHEEDWGGMPGIRQTVYLQKLNA